MKHRGRNQPCESNALSEGRKPVKTIDAEKEDGQGGKRPNPGPSRRERAERRSLKQERRQAADEQRVGTHLGFKAEPYVVIMTPVHQTIRGAGKSAADGDPFCIPDTGEEKQGRP